MAYRSPGAYARFVRTAGAVNSPGATRVMAIVGTGANTYSVVNEEITRATGRISDELARETLDIISITSRPLFKGVTIPGTVTYLEGTDFDLMEGKYIVWKNDPATANVVASGDLNVSGELSASEISGQEYLIETAEYEILVKTAGATGTYKVTKLGATADTNEVIADDVVSSATPKTDVIPGVSLTVNLSTAIAGTTTGLVTTTAPTKTSAAKVPNDKFYVSYEFAKLPSDYKPKVFFNYEDIVAEYGHYDVTASGKIINSLALGAEIAFLNGVSPIVCVQSESDADTAINEAITKLERPIAGIANVNTVIPLTASATVGAHTMQHVENMSSIINGKERMTYLAAPAGETPVNAVVSAKNYSNERVVYVVPGTVTKDIKDLRTGAINTRTLNGSYLAVAVAALGLKNDPAEPLTNKAIVGFKDLGELYTESEMNLMAEAGCLVLKQQGAVIRVRHGITTSTTDVNSAEITLVQIKDFVIEAARTSLGELYVGNKLKPTIIADVQSSLVSILNQFKGREIILGYGGIVVKRSAEDPRAIDVRFEIEAVYPLNYIDISFSFSGVN